VARRRPHGAAIRPGRVHARRAEEAAASWLIDLFGLPQGSSVGFVTGATMANFTAIAAARHAVLERVGWNVEDDGLIGAPPLAILRCRKTVAARAAMGP